MPKHANIWKYKNWEKAMKVPFINYADMESLYPKIDTCYDNPEKSSTSRKNIH